MYRCILNASCQTYLCRTNFGRVDFGLDAINIPTERLNNAHVWKWSVQSHRHIDTGTSTGLAYDGLPR